MNLKNNLNEIMDDLKGRIRNPLILTFILVWLYFHWSLIYQILTIDNAIPLDSRLNILRNYITVNKGWYGMIGKPLVGSFIALAVYYIIAITAQAIKVLLGKRFNAYMLLRLDKGNYVTKAELIEEKNNFKRLSKELEESKNSLNLLIKEREELNVYLFEANQKLNSKENELMKIQGHIQNNPQFIEKFENIILFLFSKYKSITPSHLRSSDFQKNYYKVLDGNWRVVSNSVFTKNNGPTVNWVVDNDQIKGTDGTELAEIKNFKYDKQYKILEFSITFRNKKMMEEIYNLIIINQDEMMGFCNHSFCYLKRQD